MVYSLWSDIKKHCLGILIERIAFKEREKLSKREVDEDQSDQIRKIREIAQRTQRVTREAKRHLEEAEAGQRNRYEQLSLKTNLARPLREVSWQRPE